MTPDNTSRSRLNARQETVLWLAIAGILTAAIGFSWNPTPLAIPVFENAGSEAFGPESLQVTGKKRDQHRRWQKNHLRDQRTCNARPC